MTNKLSKGLIATAGAMSIIAMTALPANASTLGDTVAVGKVTGGSCNIFYCTVDVREATGTVHATPTLDARVRYCENANINSFAYINLLNISKLKATGVTVSIVFSYPTKFFAPAKIGQVVCK